MQKDIWKLISFAATGTVELKTEHGSHAHLSGTPSDPEWFLRASHWWADPPGEMHYEWDRYEIPEDGVPVLDKRAALKTEAGSAWVFSGPMIDVDLQDGQVDRLGDVSPLMAPVIAAYGMAGCLAQTWKAQAKGQAGSLDNVSVAEYIRGWVDHGARLGRFYLNRDGTGRIEWADGEVQVDSKPALQPA